MGRNNDDTAGNLLDYEYFSKHYKLSAIDLSKQIELEHPDLKQQINFIGRLKRNEGGTMFFIIEKLRQTTFEFKQNTAIVAWFWPCIKMETQTIANLLGEMLIIISLQNLWQENVIKITQTKVKEVKMVQPLNLKPKLLNQIFVIVQTHIFL